MEGDTTVRLKKAGETDITASDVVVVTSIKVTCSLNLNGAATGAWDVYVQTSNGNDTLVGGFAVEYPAPTVTGITPGSGINNASVSITDLAGTNFRNGATVKLTKTGQSDIDGGSVNVVSAVKITCVFPVTSAQAGLWNVVVTNDDTKSGTLTNSFEIEDVYITIAAPANPSKRTFLVGSDNEYTADEDYTAVTCSANVNYDVKINCDTDANKTAAFVWEWNGTSYVPSGRKLAAAMSMKAPGGTYTAITASPTSISGFTNKPPGESVLTYVDWKQPATYGDVPLGANTYRHVLAYTIVESVL